MDILSNRGDTTVAHTLWFHRTRQHTNQLCPCSHTPHAAWAMTLLLSKSKSLLDRSVNHRHPVQGLVMGTDVLLKLRGHPQTHSLLTLIGFECVFFPQTAELLFIKKASHTLFQYWRPVAKRFDWLFQIDMWSFICSGYSAAEFSFSMNWNKQKEAVHDLTVTWLWYFRFQV